MKNFIAVLTTGDLQQTLARYSDLALAGLIILILGMLIVPLPYFLLDIFIVINMSFSVILMLLAMYIPNALPIVGAHDRPGVRPHQPGSSQRRGLTRAR